ncbi:MAG: type II toxin-antitoxin system VapC family toxin [Candidatus Sericytochromatia bacterium]
MIVLDASVLIGHFERDDAHHDAATELLLASADHDFTASVVSLAEIYVGAARRNRVADIDRMLAELGIEASPLPATAARRLADIRVATGLKLPDCCVLYAAEQLGAAVATFDAALEAAARRFGVAVA